MADLAVLLSGKLPQQSRIDPDVINDVLKGAERLTWIKIRLTCTRNNWRPVADSHDVMSILPSRAHIFSLQVSY